MITSWRRAWGSDYYFFNWRDMNMFKSCWVTIVKVWCFLKMLNIELPPDPAVLLTGVYTKELNTGITLKKHL
jgi:hypothetical protein